MMRIDGRMIILLIVLLLGCGQSRNLKTESDFSNTDDLKLKMKRITALDSIIQYDQTQILFLFNNYDCGNCVDLGFAITKRISNILKKENITVVSTMGNPSAFQERNKFYEYIHDDSKDLIRKELKYVPTPILFILDSNKRIKDYILPGVSTEEQIEAFINETRAIINL